MVLKKTRINLAETSVNEINGQRSICCGKREFHSALPKLESLKMKLYVSPGHQILICIHKALRTSLGTRELPLKQIKDIAFLAEKLPIGVL